MRSATSPIPADYQDWATFQERWRGQVGNIIRQSHIHMLSVTCSSFAELVTIDREIADHAQTTLKTPSSACYPTLPWYNGCQFHNISCLILLFCLFSNQHVRKRNTHWNGHTHGIIRILLLHKLQAKVVFMLRYNCVQFSQYRQLQLQYQMYEHIPVVFCAAHAVTIFPRHKIISWARSIHPYHSRHNKQTSSKIGISYSCVSNHWANIC